MPTSSHHMKYAVHKNIEKILIWIWMDVESPIPTFQCSYYLLKQLKDFLFILPFNHF